MSQKKESQMQETKQPRRKFIIRLSSALGILAVVEFFGIGLAFFSSKPRKVQSGQKERFFEAGPASGFTPGSVTPFAGARFFLVRLKDGGFLALSLRCSHLGCSVNWQESKESFACPCHASQFDRTGNVLNPPAPRALDFYPLQIEDGIVRINTTRVVKRDRFKSDQVVYG